MREQEPQSTATPDPDVELAELMEESMQALERLGLTVDDVLDELAAVHAEHLDSAYGAAYMRNIEQQIAQHRDQASKEPPLSEGTST